MFPISYLKIVFFILFGIVPFSFSDRHANRLLKDLLTYYSIYERPILNASEQVIVTVGVALQQLVALVSFQLIKVDKAPKNVLVSGREESDD